MVAGRKVVDLITGPSELFNLRHSVRTRPGLSSFLHPHLGNPQSFKQNGIRNSGCIESSKRRRCLCQTTAITGEQGNRASRLCRFSTSPVSAGSVAFIQRLCTSLILLHRWPGHNAFALPAASLPDLSALFSSSQPVLPAPLSRRVNNSVFRSPASPGMRSTCSTEVLNCAPRSFRGARSPWRRKIRSPSSDGAREVKTCATNPAIVSSILTRIY
jgi:hypothetical protein